MTLIEVLAGLVVLGTVLSSILIARSRFAQQLATANLKLGAAQQIDALVEGWMDSPLGPPPRSSGKFDERLVWRTREIRNNAARELRSRLVRVEVFDRRAVRPDDADPVPLLSVDLLAADPSARKLPVVVKKKDPTSQPAEQEPDQPTTAPTTQGTEAQEYEDPRLRDGLYGREK